MDFTMKSTLHSISSVQTRYLSEWYKSYDTAVKSISTIFDFSSTVLEYISRQHNQNLDVCLSAASEKVSRSTGYTSSKDTDKNTWLGVAVVTGGTGGIGTEICKKLGVNNRIIASYVITERNEAIQWKSDRKREGFDCEIIECDVTDFNACRAFADQVEKQYGRIDILINAAGITRDAVLKRMDEKNWHAVIDTNLDSVFNVTRNFINGMIRIGYGRIINISSVNGQKGQFGQANYSASKAGIIGFTRSLALELASHGITVNCLCPGYVHTNMVESIREDILESIINQIPMGRLATTTEIADAVAFLADKNSGYITGTELAVNGGLWLG